LSLGFLFIVFFEGLNYLTCTIVGWVDVFTRATYRDMIIESLSYCQQAKGLRIPTAKG
jgi:hypothetical protein